VLWDFMHPQRFCEKVECTFGHVGHLTRHIHAHDARYVENNRRTEVCDLGKGVFDHATPLRLLEQAGFEGLFSVEVIHKPGSDHDADAVMAQYAQAFAEIMSRVRGTSG
jgi:sugar phosphate isomerase/epimerase